MPATTLTYFTVTGDWRSNEDPQVSSTNNTPQVMPVSGFVEFQARLPKGFALHVASFDVGGVGRDTAILLAPRRARIWEGRLCTINAADTPGVQLVANTAELGLTDPLIYDVTFSSIRYNGTDQMIQNFAFQAPTSGGTICITDATRWIEYKRR